ncbi:MAG TPA: hypothetical protein VK815_15310, partial [Candidatus Acidoferrales bacterium]|nr:hypothetical protein [Candidatus Acidoferrales bacterium]
PHEAHDLRIQLVELGLAKLLREQPKERSLELVERFLGQKHITSGEMFSAEKVFSRLGFQDVVAKRNAGRWQSVEALRNIDWQAVSESYRSVCRIILAATGKTETKVESPPGFIPKAFGDLFQVLELWEAPAGILTAMGFNKERASAIEVVRGAIIVGGLNKSDLAREANILLLSDDPFKLMFGGNCPKSGPETDWKLAAGAQLDSALISRAFLHPSDCIQWTAARLIWGGVAVKETPEIIRSLFFKCEGNSLHYISSIAGVLWGEKAQEIIISRLHSGSRRGLRHVCRALGSLVGPKKNEVVQQELTSLLVETDLEIALGAAEGLRAMKISSSPAFTRDIERAFAHWYRVEIKCGRCNVSIEQTSCPKCHVVPPAPHGEIVRILAAIGAASMERLLELCEDDWGSVQDAAVETLTDWGKRDANLLRKLLRRFVRGGGPTKLLDALLKLPSDLLTQVIPELTLLARSRARDVRIQFFEMLPSLPIANTDSRGLATKGINDTEASVRNAAVRSLRVLSSNTKQPNTVSRDH